MTARVLQAMMEYFGQDRKRINHALKVYGFARTIALRENLDDDKRAVLECAAVLHDIGIPESIRAYGSSKAEYQEIMGSKVGGELMASLGFEKEFIGQVCFLIAHHHSYGMDGGPLHRILIEADFLVNLDEGNLGSADPAQILAKHFRTRTGRELIATLFGLRPGPPLPA